MKYQDTSDNNFPNDYDKSKVDSRIKLRTDKVDHSMWGDNVREAVSQGVQIADVTANEAKDISNKANKTSSDVKKQFDNQIKGQNKDNEAKDARISKADNKTYNTLKQRLDEMDKKPKQEVDNIEVSGVNLLTNSLPTNIGDWSFGSGGDNKYSVADGQYLEITRTGGGFHQIRRFFQDDPNSWFWDINPGDTYTISFDVAMTKVPTENTDIYGQLRENLVEDNSMVVSGNNHEPLKPIIKNANTWYRVSFTHTITDKWNNNSSDIRQARLIIESSQGADTDVIRVRHIKVEKGSKATSWTPAPQDSHRHQAFRRGTRFFAHRGAQSIAPENSRPAIQKAGNHAGVEIDIHTTADGVWMVMHDGTVDRMTNGTGAISSFTYKEIRKLKIDSGHNLNKYSGNDLIIPTLEEALADCKDHQLIPVIEIKVDDTDNYSSDNYDSLVTLINKFDLKDSCMFISFNYQALAEIKKRLPLVEVSWLQSVISKNTIARAQALGVNAGLDSSYTNKSVTLDNIKKVHDAGLKMGVWTLKDDSQRTKLIGMGVDFITTNSLSGERRYADLNTKNGWANYGGGYHSSYVQEVAPGQVTIYFNILGDKAKDAKGTVFANIPSWAVPTFNLWNECIIRNSSSVEVSTFDVVGNELRVGFNWNHRRTVGWVSGNVTYHV